MGKAQEEFGAVFGELDYPFAELLLSAGFFFVMVIEQTVMNWYEKKEQTESLEATSKNQSILVLYLNKIYIFNKTTPQNDKMLELGRSYNAVI